MSLYANWMSSSLSSLHDGRRTGSKGCLIIAMLAKIEPRVYVLKDDRKERNVPDLKPVQFPCESLPRTRPRHGCWESIRSGRKDCSCSE